MRTYKLSNMKKGWFVGNFNPTIIKTNQVEVAVKIYKKGFKENSHFHKIAKEITVISSGKVKMNSSIYKTGDIIEIEPMEITNFEALEDTITTVVKYPGAINDKYEC